jgi:Family of unknown function (DUF6464)
MEQPLSPTELPTAIILSHSKRTIGNVQLDWTPQPGSYVDVDGQTYTVLERRHRYQLRSGRYCLHQVAIYVQTSQRPEETTWVQGRWVIGDANCRFSARSELIRCAINPNGPCAGCRHFERSA